MTSPDPAPTLPCRPAPGRRFAWWILRAHWAFGLVPLAFATDLPKGLLAIPVLSLVGGTAMDIRGHRRDGWSRWSAPFLVLAAAAAGADLLLRTRDPLLSASLLVLAVQSARLLLPKTFRDGWQLCAISLLEFLAAAASTQDLRFAFFLFAYLGLSAGAMGALRSERAAEEGGFAPLAVRPLHAALFLLALAGAGALTTALVFAVTPRVGFAGLAGRLGRREVRTGFAGAISLRNVTAVKIDPSVVARIEFPRGGGNLPPVALYLKGAAYARFDGRQWTRAKTGTRRVPRIADFYPLGDQAAGAAPEAADITLEAMDNPALFSYGTPVSFEGNLGEVVTDGWDSYAIAQAGHPAIRYRVRFDSAQAVSAGGGRPARGPGGEYLQVPGDMDDLRELAARETAGSRSDRERADRLRRMFRSGFRYTLSDPAGSIREFLFGKRAGHCEHFATALALMLRAAGIPSRVAAGYLGGEWNDVGRYLIVRQSDAHAWTEAWIGGRWETLDATPPSGESSPFSSRTGLAGLYLDWAMQRWTKYIVNYSLGMQVDAATEGWSRLTAGVRRPGRAAARIACALLAAAALLFVLRRATRRPSPAGAHPGGESPPPRAYDRLARRLGALGHRKSPGTPLAEMVLSAASGRPSLLPDARRFLVLYHRDRFGSRPLPEDEAREAGRLADRLRRAAPPAAGRSTAA